MSRLTADDRVRRLLSIVPWVAGQPDGVALDELCDRFGLDRKRLVSDLNTLTFVGVYPYSPDAQVEVVIEDERVWVRLPQWFDRPLRLTPEQGLALVAAGRSLLSVPGADATGPLARGLAKLAASLDIDAGATIDVELGRAEPTVMAALREAIDAHRSLELTYYSYGRDEKTTRQVDPHRVYADQGQWYLTGYCHLAGGDRVFRIDRITEATVTDERFDPPAEPPSLGVFEAAADDPRVTLELAPDAAWVIEQYPTEGVEPLADGRVRVRLAVTAPAWLERLLLRLGPGAVVVDGSDELRAGARAAAQRVRDRYRGD